MRVGVIVIIRINVNPKYCSICNQTNPGDEQLSNHLHTLSAIANIYIYNFNKFKQNDVFENNNILNIYNLLK